MLCSLLLRHNNGLVHVSCQIRQHEHTPQKGVRGVGVGGGEGGLFKVHSQARDGNECPEQLVATGTPHGKRVRIARSPRGYPAVLPFVITGVVNCFFE